MRVLFINPPREGFFLTTERQVPIGIFYLVEACRNAGFDVHVIDMLAGFEVPRIILSGNLSTVQREKIKTNPIFDQYIRYGMDDDAVLSWIQLHKPSVVCISIMFSCFHDSAERLANSIRNQFHNIILIAGGAHVTTNYKDVLKTGSFDYCVRFEGEKSLPKLLHCLEMRTSVEEVENVAYINECIKLNNNHTWLSDLDEVHPAYDMISSKTYGRAVTIITSRGCPFKCKFCSVHLSMGRKYRKRSINNVLAEIENYTKYGFSRFNIEDDNFTFDIDRAKDIFRGIIEKNIQCEIYLLNGVGVQNLDEECIQLMSKAGVKKLFFGLETTSKKLLSVLHKSHTSLEAICMAVRQCSKYGLYAGASIIMGFPDQTINDILIDIVTLITHNIPIYAINPLYPLPGTEVFDECVSNGVLKGNEDYIFYGGDNFVIFNNSFSREDLYYLWLAIKGYTKWGFEKKYIPIGSLTLRDALRRIAREMNGIYSRDSLQIKTKIINAEMISAHYKVFVDMTRCFIYLMMGTWFSCYVKEDEILQLQYKSANEAPRVLVMLRDIINKELPCPNVSL